MEAYLFAIVLLVLAVVCILLERTYFYLPPKELKRQAAYGKWVARVLYRAASYGTDLKLLLWFLAGVFASGGFVLFARVAPPLIGFLAILLVLWLALVWLPRARLTAVGTWLAIRSTPFIVAVLQALHPGIRHVARYATTHGEDHHTGLYDLDDLYDLLERQKVQQDNRIKPEDLEHMRHVLRFGTQVIRDVMVPRKQVLAVDAHDDLGPILLDELHNSGHACFPVYEGKPGNIVGVLEVADIADARYYGKVREYARHRLTFLKDNETLEHALLAFYETRQHLFIVLDKQDRYTGILTLTDVIHWLYGAIASPEAAENTEKVSEKPSEVVE